MSIFKDIFTLFCVKAFKYCVLTLLYFQLEISNFLPEKILNSNRKKNTWPHSARGIDETSNAVQLNCFFGERFYFYNLFFQSATLPVYLFIYLFVSLFVNLPLYLTIF